MARARRRGLLNSSVYWISSVDYSAQFFPANRVVRFRALQEEFVRAILYQLGQREAAAGIQCTRLQGKLALPQRAVTSSCVSSNKKSMSENRSTGPSSTLQTIKPVSTSSKAKWVSSLC